MGKSSIPDDGRLTVDPGALALAALAAAAAFILGPGEWDVFAVVVGAALLVTILAHHRSWAGPITLRSILLRTTFAGITGIAACIMVAWPVQLLVESLWHSTASSGESRDAYNTTLALSYAWFPLTGLLALLEPKIGAALDRPLERRRRGSRD